MGHPAGLGTRAAPAAPSEPRAPPTWDATVRRGFSSADSSLGISFITMATALSAALAPLPYNSETNNGAKSAAGSDRLPRTRSPPGLAGCWPRLRLEAKLIWKQDTHTLFKNSKSNNNITSGPSTPWSRRQLGSSRGLVAC